MGAQVFSTSESESAYLRDDTSNPSRVLIRQVLGAAQYEKGDDALRLRSGMARKHQNGGYAYEGSPVRLQGREWLPGPR
jgi:hypothetical protein